MDSPNNLPNKVQDSYRVEVSGWDIAENFFVEKTNLDWRGGEKKEVTLRSSVREGSVLFVRLLQTTTWVANTPITYQATKLMESDAQGYTRVSLIQLRPRRQRQDLYSSDPPVMKEIA